MFQPCEVVLLPFPFSDLSSTKRRPALIRRSLATYGDIVALAVTSRSGHPAGCAALIPGERIVEHRGKLLA